MEIKFNETACQCLHTLVDQMQSREQTQEVRLTDGMPDIGRVLGCWGQTVIRSKEWRSDSIGVSGGVQGWVLYAPEDDGPLQTVEVWLPFQMKWELPQTRRDGFIWVESCVRSMDARNTSARKLMVRTEIRVLARAMENEETVIFKPQELPEDVHLRNADYPMELPVEFGEKLVTLDEELTLPSTQMPAQKLMYCAVRFSPAEDKILSSRLVFKGKAFVHIVYSDGDKLHGWDFEIPYSQFVDLDREHGANARGKLMPMLTELELIPEDGKLHLKAAVAVQYVIHDRVMVELVEDAYSPVRTVVPVLEKLQMPMELDRMEHALQPEVKWDAQAESVTDVWLTLFQPQIWKEDGGAQLTMQGQFQVLYYDSDGMAQCGVCPWEQAMKITAAPETAVEADVTLTEVPRVELERDGMTLAARAVMSASVCGRGVQSMVCGLEMGEIMQPDPNRPSLILRRCDDGGLWELAKSCGSTVEAIRLANGLQTEPQSGQILLIPVC